MTKLDELINWFNEKDRVLVALSGGVDSALVAYAAFQNLGNSATAVTADYKTLSRDELSSAQRVCSEIGIKQIVINYNELENENFVQNDKNRCFYCRDELTKNQVRDEAKRINLSVFDRPSNSCLASRIPWGQRISAERLTRIEVGESIVKQTLGANQVRVRDLDGIAKIEVGKNELELFSDKLKMDEIILKLEQIGFKSVIIDPEGYKSGKINVIAD